MARTVPSSKIYLNGKVLSSKMYLDGTVPSTNKYGSSMVYGLMVSWTAQAQKGGTPATQPFSLFVVELFEIRNKIDCRLKL